VRTRPAREGAGEISAVFSSALAGLFLCVWATCAWASQPLGSAPVWAEPRFHAVGLGQIPRDVVPRLTQDKAGFLWIATGDGLVRYDGHRFMPQERHSTDPAARNLGWVRALHAGRDGRVWIGTEADGLAAYEPDADRIVSHRVGSEGGALPTIIALAEDGDGAIWIGTAGAGIERYHPTQRRSVFHRSEGQPGQLPDNHVGALLVDRRGDLWVGTWQGLSRRVRGGSGFEPAGGTLLAGQSVQALLQTSDGRLWVGTQQGGVFVVEPETGAVQAVAPATSTAASADGLPGGAVNALAEAPGGTVWVGRVGGIDLASLQQGRWLGALRHDPRRRHGLAGNEVSTLLLDAAGTMWVAGYGLGLQRHDTGNDAIRLRDAELHAGSPWTDADVRAVAQLADGRVWLAPHSGGVVQLDAALGYERRLALRGIDGLPLRVNTLAALADGGAWLGESNALHLLDARGQTRRVLRHTGGQTLHILPARGGAIWASTEDGLFLLETGAAALQRVALADGRPLGGAVHVAAEYADGALWVGTSAGLFRIDPGQRRLRAIDTDDRGAGLANPIVIGLLIDRAQTLWVDTAVAGLHRLSAWDGQRARFDRVSARHGVYSRPFGASLQQDKLGRIWTAMHVYDPSGDRLHALTAADGVIFGTGWFRASAHLSDGQLLFGGSRGLLVVQPERWQPAVDQPPLRLTDLRVNGQPRPAPDLTQGLTLKPGDRSVSVEFAALEYRDPARNRYVYRLDGFDPDWIATGAELRVASYSNLDPGEYTLRVRASNRNGVWGPTELSLPLRVLPAWWQQAAAHWIGALALLMLFFALLQWRTRHLRGQRQALAQAVQARTAELQAARDELEDRVQTRTRDLAAATAAAVAANAAKTAFLHHVSHDMRTPLNAIIGLTHLQQADTPDAAQRWRLGQVLDAAQQLRGQVDDVLALAADVRGGAAGQPTAAPPAAPLPRFAGQRVLVADDDAVNQIVARGLLEQAGLRVDIAADGAEAVRMAATTPYALVLMDLRMPVLDGLGATRAIRQSEAPGTRMPIIAFSAYAMAEDRQACLDAGMDDHLAKPADLRVLLATVARWLQPTGA
jgi:ligand-binding sensor domain-containing protein/CheY-like chemotaxis protein